MVVCFLCKEEFKDNLGGQLTNHLLKMHHITMADYVIITEYNNIEPRCVCGYCHERPSFYRGKFLEYASGHDRFKWKVDQYIKKFGIPKCKTCGKDVNFKRGVPNIYCDSKCRPSCWNQDQVNKTVKEKYGVDNVMFVEEFRNNSLIRAKNAWVLDYHKILDKKKKTTFEIYGVEFASQCESVKIKQSESVMKLYGVSHYSKTDKFRNETSKRMMLNNPYNCIDKWKNNAPKKYKSTDLSYQSSYEYDFLEFCESHNVLHLIKKSPSFRYMHKDSYHFPDYLYNNDTVIEIKSKWILDIQGGEYIINEKIKSVEYSGEYKYLLILDKDYLQFEKIICN